MGVLRESGSENVGAKEAGTFQKSGGQVHVKINGVAKTLPRPVTGDSLRRLAGEIPGHPVTLTSGGKIVPRDNQPLEVKDGQEFSTTTEPQKPAVVPAVVKTEPVAVKTDPELA
jgi:hypothetical protein